MNWLCRILGHRTMLKAFTGNIIKITHPLNMYPQNVPTYKWERQRYCIRCGVDVWKP